MILSSRMRHYLEATWTHGPVDRILHSRAESIIISAFVTTCSSSTGQVRGTLFFFSFFSRTYLHARANFHSVTTVASRYPHRERRGTCIVGQLPFIPLIGQVSYIPRWQSPRWDSPGPDERKGSFVRFGYYPRARSFSVPRFVVYRFGAFGQNSPEIERTLQPWSGQLFTVSQDETKGFAMILCRKRSLSYPSRYRRGDVNDRREYYIW